jgi:hypothetical protein
VLLLAPTRRSMHLEGWIGRLDEPAVVVDAGGSLASFCRPGQTLAARHIRTMAAQIIQRGEVERAVIGAVIGEIALGDPIRHEMPGLGALPATMVMRVAPNSPAAAAGLQRGDVLLSMGGEPSGDLSSFAALLCVLRGPTRLEILRNGRPMQAIIDLRPAANGPATTADRPVGHNAAVPPLQPP